MRSHLRYVLLDGCCRAELIYEQEMETPTDVFIGEVDLAISRLDEHRQTQHFIRTVREYVTGRICRCQRWLTTFCLCIAPQLRGQPVARPFSEASARYSSDSRISTGAVSGYPRHC